MNEVDQQSALYPKALVLRRKAFLWMFTIQTARQMFLQNEESLLASCIVFNVGEQEQEITTIRNEKFENTDKKKKRQEDGKFDSDLKVFRIAFIVIYFIYYYMESYQNPGRQSRGSGGRR